MFAKQFFIHDGSPYNIETSPMDWFLHDRDLRHERVKEQLYFLCTSCRSQYIAVMDRLQISLLILVEFKRVS